MRRRSKPTFKIMMIKLMMINKSVKPKQNIRMRLWTISTILFYPELLGGRSPDKSYSILVGKTTAQQNSPVFLLDLPLSW